jgi:hypothetical protein
VAESSAGRMVSGVWKSIWGLKMANTEKHFLWRACHDIM